MKHGQVTLATTKDSRRFLNVHLLLISYCVKLLLFSLNPYNMLTANVNIFALSKTAPVGALVICTFSGSPFEYLSKLVPSTVCL